MAKITLDIDTNELDTDQLGSLIHLLGGEQLSGNGHTEAPVAPATRTVPPKAPAKAAAKTTTAKRTASARATHDDDLVDEPVGGGEDELMDDPADAEPVEPEAAEEEEPGLGQEDLENMSLVEVRKVATVNEVDFKATTKKPELIQLIMDKAESDWLAEQGE